MGCQLFSFKGFQPKHVSKNSRNVSHNSSNNLLCQSIEKTISKKKLVAYANSATV